MAINCTPGIIGFGQAERYDAAMFWLGSSHEWRPTTLWWPRIDIHGNSVSGFAWVRTVSGVKQYRPMTDEESRDYVSRETI
ncbi:MAG TPA: hypothetical protein VJQ06_05200 [Rhizomicrobium sp.]|nr:hypothetical protein [Rhizomicrobium sp.]